MASTAIPVATLKANGGAPEVEIVVGHLHRADYQLLLFDTHGANPTGIGSPDGKGKTGDQIADRFPLGLPIADLHRRTLFWQAGLVAFVPEGDTEPFSVVIRVLQDGNIVGLDGGSGVMSKPHASGMIHLKVVQA
jgi:hypothetical protein